MMLTTVPHCPSGGRRDVIAAALNSTSLRVLTTAIVSEVIVTSSCPVSTAKGTIATTHSLLVFEAQGGRVATVVKLLLGTSPKWMPVTLLPPPRRPLPHRNTQEST